MTDGPARRTGWPANGLRRAAVDIARLLATLALLNAPFWLLAHLLFLPRALFSLDSVLALGLMLVSPILGTLAIGLSWACDLTTAASLTYHFASPLDFVRSAAFAGHLDWSRIIDARTLLLVAPFAAAVVGLTLLRPQRLRWQALAGALAVLMVLDTVNGSSPLSTRDVRLLGANLAGSSLLFMARTALDEERDADALVPTGGSGGVAEFETLLPGVIAKTDSVLYVLVESLGIHSDPGIRDWLTQQLNPPGMAQAYTLWQGHVKVSGGTPAAELRRLCGLQGSYRKLRTAPLQPCLPTQMANSGRTVVGLHGFSERMFDRQRWWPLLGLQRTEFAEQLLPRVDRQCGGAFQGICDEDLIKEAVAAVAQPRSFVYALTLNTHLPLAPIPISPDLEPLCQAAQTGDEVCMLLEQLAVLLRSIPRTLLEQASRPYVVLVGDHPPPFASLHARSQFASGLVPIFVLTPKAAAQR